MLSDASVTAVLPVGDLARATAFYRDQLGLRHTGESEGGNHAVSTNSGGTIELMAAEPGAQSAHTAATFGVAALEQEIGDLEARGVRFEDYDTPDLKTVDHIATFGTSRAAWFTDTEGNILCLHEVHS